MGVNLDGSIFFQRHAAFGTLVAVCAVLPKADHSFDRRLFPHDRDIFTENSTGRAWMRTAGWWSCSFSACCRCSSFYPDSGHRQQHQGLLRALGGGQRHLIEGVCFLITGLLLTLGIRRSKQNSGRHSRTPGGRTQYHRGRRPLRRPDAGNRRAAGVRARLHPFGGTAARHQQAKALDYSFILGVPAVLGPPLLEFKDALETGAALSRCPSSSA